MSKTRTRPIEQEEEQLPDFFGSSDATLLEWPEASQPGQKSYVVSLPHSDPKTVPSETMLNEVFLKRIIRSIKSIIWASSERDMFFAGWVYARSLPKKRKMSFVESRLIDIGIQCSCVNTFLREEHGIEIPREGYLDWRRTLFADRSAIHSDVIVAIDLLDTSAKIGNVIIKSVGERFAPLTLDSALQLSKWFAYCEKCFSILELEAIKERGWREFQAKNRRNAAMHVRNEIRERMKKLLKAPNSERYRYATGKRKGRLRIDYFVGRIQSDFNFDDAWQKKAPGKTVLREEIRKFNNTEK